MRGVGWGWVGCGEGHGAEKCLHTRGVWAGPSKGSAVEKGQEAAGGSLDSAWGWEAVQSSLDLALWKGAPACPSQNQDNT